MRTPQCKYSSHYLNPGYEQSSDLEPATKTIVAVAQPALPDYTFTNSLTGFVDADTGLESTRVIPRRWAARLVVDIDSFNAGCTKLNYRVETPGLSTMSGFWNAVGVGKFAWTSGSITTGSDVTGKTSNIFFWVDAGNAVISLVTLLVSFGFGYGIAYSAQRHTKFVDVRGIVSIMSSAITFSLANSSDSIINEYISDLYASNQSGIVVDSNLMIDTYWLQTAVTNTADMWCYRYFAVQLIEWL